MSFLVKSMRMMIRRTLLKTNNPWRTIELGSAKRVDINGHYDFFWAVIDNNLPSLMLKLKSLPSPLPKLPRLKSLQISFRSLSEGTALVISLKENSQTELFETLCHDVISAGEAATTLESSLHRVIQRTYRWYHLLKGGLRSGMTIEEQRGLIGELYFLSILVKELGPEKAIESWLGPFGSSKDFEFIDTCIEVKTRRVAAKPNVTISSEDQLADVENSRVFLNVISVSSEISNKGKSLHDYVISISNLIKCSESATLQWEEAIYASGYDPDHDYEERCWVVNETKLYEITETFPRIVPPIPNGIKNVKYSLSLEACIEYEFKDNIIDLILKGIANE